MRLFVDGRDISYVEYGDVDTGEHKKYSGEPETYLKHLDDFLKSCGKTVDSLTEAHIMIGEGSSTALRASLAIINTIAFTKRIHIYAYRADRTREHIFGAIRSGDLQGEILSDFATPVYAHAPRMTPTKKDQLNRKF